MKNCLPPTYCGVAADTYAANYGGCRLRSSEVVYCFEPLLTRRPCGRKVTLDKLEDDHA